MDAHDLFEILVREHAPMLTVYLRAVVRDAALVDDLFQETMLTAWKTLDRYDRTRPFGPWLRGIAGRLVLAARRKHAEAVQLCDAEILEAIDARLTQLNHEPGDTLDEKLDCLRRCLQALPKHYREVVQLRFAEEAPAESLADKLAISLETWKKRLQRGRALLVECLNRKLAAGGAS